MYSEFLALEGSGSHSPNSTPGGRGILNIKFTEQTHTVVFGVILMISPCVEALEDL